MQDIKRGITIGIIASLALLAVVGILIGLIVGIVVGAIGGVIGGVIGVFFMLIRPFRRGEGSPGT
jgi:ABC-type dipeptide/oligopeptide/nickel transport system permease subunit